MGKTQLTGILSNIVILDINDNVTLPFDLTVSGLAGTGGVVVADTLGLLSVSTNYYTKTELQTSGSSAVHWNNLTNVPQFIPDGDKGDITVSSGGTVWTIDPAAVTYSKIQNVAANTFLANITGVSASVQEVATNRIPLFSSAITGVPSNSTWLRGDGAWETLPILLPGTPVNSIQFNNAGSFGGSAGLIYSLGPVMGLDDVQHRVVNHDSEFDFGAEYKANNGSFTGIKSTALYGGGMSMFSFNMVPYTYSSGYNMGFYVPDNITGSAGIVMSDSQLEFYTATLFGSPDAFLRENRFKIGLTAGVEIDFSPIYQLDVSADNVKIAGLRTGGTAPTTTGLTRVVITDANGKLSFSSTPLVGLTDGDKGDITVSGSGSVWTIDNSAVTLSKIQDVAANTFLANVTGSPAVVQEISTGRIPLFASNITGTPSGSTFLRGDGTWSALGGTPLSSITNALATNTINNSNFAQTWNWTGITNQTALKLASSGNAGLFLNPTLLELESNVNIDGSGNSIVTTLSVANTGISSGGTATKNGVSIVVYGSNFNTSSTTNGIVVSSSNGYFNRGGIFTSTGAANTTFTSTGTQITATNGYTTYGIIVSSTTQSNSATTYGVQSTAAGGDFNYALYGIANATIGTSRRNYGAYLSASGGDLLNYALFTNLGKIRLGDLQGSGTRMVVVDPDGELSSQTIPSGGSGFSVTNEGDNRVITSSGSGTGNAESNLSFDGTTLLVTGTGQLTSLAGIGNRMVIADASGVLSTQAIPSSSGPQNLDQVLAVGNVTNDQIIFDNTTTGAYEYNIMRPYNVGVSYGAKGTAGYFSSGWQSFNVNGSGRPDVVATIWGYNHGMGGQRVYFDEAAVGFRVETHYESGGDLLEIHVPEFTAYNGSLHRLLSWYAKKDNSSAGGPRFETDQLELFKWGDQLITYAAIGQSGEISIATAVDGGKFPGIQIGSLIPTIQGVTSSNWSIELTSRGDYISFGHTNTSLGNNSENIGSIRTLDNLWVGIVPGYGGGLNDMRTFQLGGYQLIHNLKSNITAFTVIQENRDEIAAFAYPSNYSFQIFKEAVKLRNGTTAQRPSSPENGMIRYNTDDNKFEFYENSVWINIGTGGGSSLTINNNGDNRILTANGGTASIDAEANFTWNGSTASIVYNTSGADGLTIKNQNTTDIGSLRVLNNSDQYGQLFKSGSAYGPYKSILAGDFGLYTTSGDIIILNDNVSGKIKLSAGGSATPNLEISSTGSVKIANLSGTGTRMVVADDNGVLSTQTIPGGGSALTINNNANNRILTANGGTTSIDAEAGITWDGSIFTVGGNIVVDPASDWYLTHADIASSIILGIEASWGYFFYNMGARNLEIASNGTGWVRFRNTGAFTVESLSGSGTRMVTVDSSGNFGSAAIPSGGPTYTFSQGLTNTAGSVTLGGNVTDDVVINGSGTLEVSLVSVSLGGTISLTANSSLYYTNLGNKHRFSVDGTLGSEKYIDYDTTGFTLFNSNLVLPDLAVASQTRKLVVDENGIVSSVLDTGGGDITDAANLGTGQGVYDSKTGSIINLKSLKQGTNITLSSTGTEITINATASGIIVADKVAIGTATFWSTAFEVGAYNASGILRVGSGSDNTLRIINIAAVLYVTQANFTANTWVQCGLISDADYRPTHTIYWRGPLSVDGTKYTNVSNTAFTGSNSYSDMELRIDSNGQIFVNISSVSTYAQLSGGNIVIVPINISYHRNPNILG